METKVRGGIEIGDSIEIYDHKPGLLLRLRLKQVYMSVPHIDFDISDQVQFLVLDRRSPRPEQFTTVGSPTAGQITYIRLDTLLKEQDFANRLLADALVFAGPGVFSKGQKEEWTQMVQGHLKRAGIESGRST